MHTDWDLYYSRPARTTSVTRKITERKILACLRMHQGDPAQATILEMGGANSCFYSAITNELRPSQYIIVDNNRKGLDQFLVSHPDPKGVLLIERDVLKDDEPLGISADIVFSAGLIEHFDVAGTKECIEAHFCAARKGGIVLITFPTPTWLYRITRKTIEWMGMWIFHDERPLQMTEVENEMSKYGIIIHKSITWPIFLTQGVIAVRVENQF